MLAREVEARMLERLQYIKLEPGRILDAGCGEGHGAERLAERYPGAQVLGLDFALPLLQAARGHDTWLRRAWIWPGPIWPCIVPAIRNRRSRSCAGC